MRGGAQGTSDRALRPHEVRGDGGPAHDLPRLGAFDRGDRAAANRRALRLYFVVAQGRARQLDEPRRRAADDDAFRRRRLGGGAELVPELRDRWRFLRRGLQRR